MHQFLRKAIVTLAVALALFAPNGVEAAQIIRPGDRGSEVVFLQERLNSLGYSISAIDGVYGDTTKIAVQDFQISNGLDVDGVVGYQTWNALRSGNTQVSRGQRNRYGTGNLIQTAKRFLGVPYLWGGDTPQGFDCSGFTQYVFEQNGIRLPRTADMQYEIGVPINNDSLQPGDIVFFTTYTSGPSHDGIYIGNGLFINSSSSRGVSIARMDNPYWAPRYIGAKRIIR